MPTWNNTSTGQNGTLQTWTVPTTGVYLIEARGAAGGGNGNYGRGARISGRFTLNAGSVLKIMVGQRGTRGSGGSAGGGGGTFVTDNSNNPLIIAGGGGGCHTDSTPRGNADAVLGTTAQGWNGSTGGTGPNGGTGNTNNSGCSGGGGLTGDGGAGTYGGGGRSFTNGGAGGSTSYDALGGYGGGGGTHGNTAGGGGGGGYGGGGGGNHDGSSGHGGGGSCYNGGSSQTGAVDNTGEGQVTATLIERNLTLPYTESFEVSTTLDDILHESDGGGGTWERSTTSPYHGSWQLRNSYQAGSHRKRFDKFRLPGGVTQVYVSAVARANGILDSWNGGGPDIQNSTYIALWDDTAGVEVTGPGWSAGELSNGPAASGWSQRAIAMTVNPANLFRWRLYAGGWDGRRLTDFDFVYLGQNVQPGVPTGLTATKSEANAAVYAFTATPISGKGIGAEYQRVQYVLETAAGVYIEARETGLQYGDTVRSLTWSALPQGAYRVRARTMDNTGAVGAYTAYVYFDVILTPYVPRIML